MTGSEDKNEKFEAWSRGIFQPTSANDSDISLLLDKNTRIDFISKLFREFEGCSTHYSDKQVAEGLRKFVHPGWSDEIFLLFDKDIPVHKRARAIESLAGVLDFFGKKCGRNLNANRATKLSPLDKLGLDWWDIFPAHPASDEPARRELDIAFLSLFENALQSSSPVVQELALHGLGHWQHAYPEKIEDMISDYLRRTPNIGPDLKEYAEAAREGTVY
ncbi:MAG: hypothetical protein HYV14_18285 [Elusimicrobia bacterium]|nr:hypothetical protein [Elusimicrobiota bacterium]